MPLSLLQYPKISSGSLNSPKRDDWVATEKIHGAQLVVGASADEVRIGKRKAWLEPGEPFFGWQMLRPSLHALARSVHRAMGATGEVWIYGELFGGHYPHPAVTPVAGLVPVQTGIWYAPDLQFAVFDVVHASAGAERSFPRPRASACIPRRVSNGSRVGKGTICRPRPSASSLQHARA